MTEYRPSVVLIENAERCDRTALVISAAKDLEKYRYKNGTELSFLSENENHHPYVINGLYKAEKDRTWADKEMVMQFKLDAVPGTKVQCAFELAGEFNKSQRVMIKMNGDMIHEEQLYQTRKLDFGFTMPETQYVTLTFSFPDAASAHDLGLSTDTRCISLALQKFKMTWQPGAGEE